MTTTVQHPEPDPESSNPSHLDPDLQNEIFIEQETVSSSPSRKLVMCILGLEFLIYGLSWLLGLVVIIYLGWFESWLNCSANFQSWLILSVIFKFLHLLMLAQVLLKKCCSCCRFQSRYFTVFKVFFWLGNVLIDLILAIWGTVILATNDSCLTNEPVNNLAVILLSLIVATYWFFTVLFLLVLMIVICVFVLAWENRSENVRKSTPQMIQNNSFSSVIINLADLNNGICDICFDDFSVGDNIRRLKCEHYFHKNCIDTWLKQSQLCPNCRQNIIQAHSLFTQERADLVLQPDQLSETEKSTTV